MGYPRAAMIHGRATTEGTARYRARFSGRLSADHFRQARGLWLSSVGLGTYLGEPTEEDDQAYRGAVAAAIRSGANVLDSAINYRFQRSERAVGAALGALIGRGEARRDEIVVATKGGFIPFDGSWPRDPRGWVLENLLRPGICSTSDIVADCHCMAPSYLDHQFEASRRNLDLETIDLYYVHNPETQLPSIERGVFLERLRGAFEVLERKVAEGKLTLYGTATWDGLRRPPDAPGHLALADVLEAAERAAKAAGSARSHFGAVQLPLNLAMPEALLHPTQATPGGGDPLPAVAAAAAAGLIVMASASILQGHLVAKMPADLAARIPGGSTPAQKGIQFVRSAPGVATALVGMRSGDHVSENLGIAADARLTPEQLREFLAPAR